MDDELFHELIRRALMLTTMHLPSEFDDASDCATIVRLISQIEREIRDRELIDAANRENTRLAVKGP